MGISILRDYRTPLIALSDFHNRALISFCDQPSGASGAVLLSGREASIEAKLQIDGNMQPLHRDLTLPPFTKVLERDG